MRPVLSFRLPSSLFFSLVFNKLVTEGTGKLMTGMHLRRREERKEAGKSADNDGRKKAGSSTLRRKGHACMA